MRKLYEIDEQLAGLIDLDGGSAVDPDTGELLNQNDLDGLQLEKEAKLENCLLVLKNDKAESDMVDKEIKRLQARKKTIDNHREWLHNYVQQCLHGEKFKGTLSSVYYRSSKSVVVPDINLVPEEFIKFTLEPRKTDIMDAYKAGEDISAYATIEEKINMIVR